MYKVPGKSTHWLINSRKPNNSQVHQLIGLQTQEFINLQGKPLSERKSPC